jgi:hypothetical protein
MATKANIVIDQGTTFNTVVSLTDENGDSLDLTAYTANAQIRKWYTSSNAVAFTTNTANGSVSLSLTANQSSSLESGRYVYDIVVTDGSNTVTRIVEGIVTVTPRVTK